MRLIFICNESPFPANHGGRVDVWRRLCALKAAGAEIFLVFWSGDSPEEIPNEISLARMAQEVSALSFYVIRRTLLDRIKRLFYVIRFPSHAASRLLGSKDKAFLFKKAQSFKPDAVWLESIYGGVLGYELSDALNVPLFCRSHNIEHLYMKKQVLKATKWRDRIAWGLNLLHLRSFETGILQNAAKFFDISRDDLRFWQETGLNNGEWLPPMVDSNFSKRLSECRSSSPSYDIGYLGNLFSPNNVDGVLWLLDKVIGPLLSIRPELKVLISGSRPVDSVKQAAKKYGVTLIANPEDVVPILRDARVLVNPVFAGSGVNIKSVEMLFSPAHIISTTQGLFGLPKVVTKHFRCADSPDSFVKEILDALDTPDYDFFQDRAVARAEFSFSRAIGLIHEMELVINNYIRSKKIT